MLQEKCHQYWPAERSARYQYFVVDPMAEYNMPQYILREFKVTDARVRPPWSGLASSGASIGRTALGLRRCGDHGSVCFCPHQDGQSRTIRQFQFTDWPEQGVPKSGEGFIDFIGQVHKTKEQFGQDGPITVHCRCSCSQNPSVIGVYWAFTGCVRGGCRELAEHRRGSCRGRLRACLWGGGSLWGS